MKTIITISFLFVFGAEIIAQDWNYYTKKVAINGVVSEGTVPVLFDIDLSSHILIKIDGDVFKSFLPSESIVYSGFSNTSNVMFWENMGTASGREILIYNHDIAEQVVDFCIIYEKSKVCYLDIKKLE